MTAVTGTGNEPQQHLRVDQHLGSPTPDASRSRNGAMASGHNHRQLGSVDTGSDMDQLSYQIPAEAAYVGATEDNVATSTTYNLRYVLYGVATGEPDPSRIFERDGSNVDYISWIHARWAEWRRENGLSSGDSVPNMHAVFNGWLTERVNNPLCCLSCSNVATEWYDTPSGDYIEAFCECPPGDVYRTWLVRKSAVMS